MCCSHVFLIILKSLIFFMVLTSILAFVWPLAKKILKRSNLSVMWPKFWKHRIFEAIDVRIECGSQLLNRTLDIEFLSQMIGWSTQWLGHSIWYSNFWILLRRLYIVNFWEDLRVGLIFGHYLCTVNCRIFSGTSRLKTFNLGYCRGGSGICCTK